MLDPEFRLRLNAVLADLVAAYRPFRAIELWRTVPRQAWLYASSRTRPGQWLTDRDGVKALSRHQGRGMPGTGAAADLWPLDGAGHVFCPKGDDPIWITLAETAEAHGLIAGLRWHHVDADHLELPV